MIENVEIDQPAHDMLIAIPRDDLADRLPGIFAAVMACMVGAIGPEETGEILIQWADKMRAQRIVGHA